MTIEELVSEMIRLATSGGAGLGVVLLVLVLGALAVILGRKLMGWHPKVDPPQNPEPGAVWDPSVDTSQIGSKPGGSDDQNQAG